MSSDQTLGGAPPRFDHLTVLHTLRHTSSDTPLAETQRWHEKIANEDEVKGRHERQCYQDHWRSLSETLKSDNVPFCEL